MIVARKTVLLVDDDPQFLDVLQTLAQTANAEWNIITAGSTALALSTLQQHPVDVIVVDFRMPVVDGVQLLQLIQNKYPHVRRIILSGHLDERARGAAAQAGAELILEKPVSSEGFQNVLAALGELARWQSEQGFRGVLRRVGIEDVIQMECLSRHSLVLDVSSPAKRGKIFICKGDLIHAECGGLAGEPALDELLSLTGGEFRHVAYEEPPARSLEGSWEFLLMEAVRRRDEKAGVGEPTSRPSRPSTTAGSSPALIEMVVCGSEGQVLHATESTDPATRAALLATINQCGQQLGTMFPLGMLERVEFFGKPERVLARFTPNGAVFVRGTVNPA